MILLRWRHPTLNSITEVCCKRHLGVATDALNLVGIVWGFMRADEGDAEQCTRCLWEARGVSPVNIRLALESLILDEIARELGPDPEVAPHRQR